MALFLVKLAGPFKTWRARYFVPPAPLNATGYTQQVLSAVASGSSNDYELNLGFALLFSFQRFFAGFNLQFKKTFFSLIFLNSRLHYELSDKL